MCKFCDKLFTSIKFWRLWSLFNKYFENEVHFDSFFLIRNVNGECIVNFSTIAGNIASQICMVHTGTSTGQHKYYLFNIVNNSQTSSECSCVVTYTKVTVEECTVVGPHGNWKPFCTYTVNFLIINCKVDQFGIYQSDGTYSTLGVIKGSELNTLSHISFKKCLAAQISNVNNKQNTIVPSHHKHLAYILSLDLFMCC